MISHIQHLHPLLPKKQQYPRYQIYLRSWTFTDEELNMIMEVDAKIDHDNMLNAFRQSAAEAIVHREEKLLLDKRFVAAEKAILKHNLHTHKIPHIYKLQCPALKRQSGLTPLIQKSMSYNNKRHGLLIVSHEHRFLSMSSMVI